MKEKLIGSALLMAVLSPNQLALSQRRPTATQGRPSARPNKLDSQAKLKQQIEEKVKAIIIDELGVTGGEVTAKARFVDDLGADSLDFVELIMRFEEEFNIEISDKDAEKIKTVGDAYKYIEQRRKDKKKA